MTGDTRKIAGWLWAGLFRVLLFLAGLALVGGGTVLATYAWGLLWNDLWQMAVGIVLLVAGVAVFVGGVILLFRITSIPVPGRARDDASTGEYFGYTNPGAPTHNSHGHLHGGGHGGGHDGGGGGGN